MWFGRSSAIAYSAHFALAIWLSWNFLQLEEHPSHCICFPVPEHFPTDVCRACSLTSFGSLFKCHLLCRGLKAYPDHPNTTAPLCSLTMPYFSSQHLFLPNVLAWIYLLVAGLPWGDVNYQRQGHASLYSCTKNGARGRANAFLLKEGMCDCLSLFWLVYSLIYI